MFSRVVGIVRNPASPFLFSYSNVWKIARNDVTLLLFLALLIRVHLLATVALILVVLLVGAICTLVGVLHVCHIVFGRDFFWLYVESCG